MFDTYKCHLLFGLLIYHTWNIKMDALTSFIVWEMIEKISLANSHLPQLIGFVLMSIGYTLGNKFYLPEIKQK